MGAKVHKTYDRARTPYQRLLESQALSRRLGAHARVGNRLIHLDTRKLDRPWGQAMVG